MKTIKQILIVIAALSMLTTSLTIVPVSGQVPDNCGESYENRCVVTSEEDEEKIKEEFPDAEVEANEEFYNELDTEATPIEEMEESEEEESEDSESEEEDSGDSGSSDKNVGSTDPNAVPSDSGGDILPGDKDNFAPLPPGKENLPPAEQSGAGLNQACLDSGFSQEKCTNMLFSDDPGGYCSTLKLAGLPCPQIQDPRFTYGDPEAAEAESNQKRAQTEEAIRGFDNTVPNNLGEGFVIK